MGLPQVTVNGDDDPSGDAALGGSDKAGWHDLIRAERRRLGITQTELAERAGLSPETVRKYEGGTRTPSRERIERVLSALQAPHTTVRRVLLDLGMAAPGSLYGLGDAEDYRFTIPELRAFVEQTPWPQFVINNTLEIVAANAATQALWEMDLSPEVLKRTRARVNLLAILVHHRLRQSLGNRFEIMAIVVSVLKVFPESRTLLDEPGSLFAEVFDAFAATDPMAINKLYALWERTPPASQKLRWNFPVIWAEPEIGEVRMIGTVTAASHVNSLVFVDWIPRDGRSHALLETLLASRALRPGDRARSGGASARRPRPARGPRDRL
ncbi:MAG: helix-turn-helix transcriptional regulator [Chloroflexota bacterium]